MSMYHYLSMSKSFLVKVVDHEKVKLKDYLYAFRTALAGCWVREHGTLPPLVFTEMFELLQPFMQRKLMNLIALKMEKDESYMHLADSDLNELLVNVITENEAKAKSLPSVKTDWDQLNAFFLRWTT